MSDSGIEAAMQERGLRRTPQRLAVWRYLSSAPGATIREVARSLQPNGIGQATVYRTVRVLERAGLLLSFPAPEGELRYVAVLGHAHLLVCESCGAVTRMEECRLGAYEQDLERETGYEVHGHTLVVYGLCPRCRGGLGERA